MDKNWNDWPRICLALLGGYGAAAVAEPPATATRLVTVDIESQPVGAALNQLAQQSGMQVIFYSDVADGIESPAIAGTVTPDAALTRLLAHTGLTFDTLNETTFVVQREAVDDRAAVAEKEAKPTRQSVEEIVVTGSRLKLPNEIQAAPITILDRHKIDALGVSTVAELMRHVPQISFQFDENYQLGGAQLAQLRGLGFDTTLVLINGRRALPSAVNLSSNAFDLNTLPLAAVERVEVLSDSASAVYGADAVGGVINIVLKQDIPRPVVDLSIGTAEGGGRERRASVGGGYRNERLRAALTLDYFDKDFLLGAERDRWANQDFTRFGGTDMRVVTANPGNVRSRTPANLPGLPSRFAAVPEGSSGVGLTPADFLETAGQRNLSSLSAYDSVVPQARRSSAVLNAQFDVSSHLKAFIEAMYVDRINRSRSGLSVLSSARVPASNAFNPFGVDVLADYLIEGVGPRYRVAESTLNRTVAGLRGDIGRWDWEVAGAYSDEAALTWDENVVDRERVAAALASTDPATALNVFQDGPGGSPQLLASLLTRTVYRFESGGEQASVFVRGPLFSLPAGEAQMVVGAEYRREDIYSRGSVFVEHDRTVNAAFAEARFPLLGGEVAAPLLHEVSLTLAGRQDHYNDFGSSFNPQYGLRWKPVRDLLVNASYGTSFRAPALFELYAPRLENLKNSINDPRRNGELTPFRQLSGGNPDLDSVKGKSWSVGAVYTPSQLPDWRLSVSYWNTLLDGRIAIFQPTLVLANESLFSQRVIRRPPTPADIAAGLPGVIDTIDASRINFGRTTTDGVDAAVSFSKDTRLGRWSWDLSATWVDDYDAVLIPNTPVVERVGVASLDGTITRWRGSTTLGWLRSGWGASLTARYIDSYADRTAFGEDRGRTIPSQVLLDAQVSLAAGEVFGEWADGFKLTFGAVNLLDEAPPFAEIFYSLGYDLSQGDLRQRFGYLRLSYEF